MQLEEGQGSSLRSVDFVWVAGDNASLGVVRLDFISPLVLNETH